MIPRLVPRVDLADPDCLVRFLARPPSQSLNFPIMSVLTLVSAEREAGASEDRDDAVLCTSEGLVGE